VAEGTRLLSGRRRNPTEGSNPSLSAAFPAPSHHVAERRWHPSVLAPSGCCAPPTSPKAVLASFGSCARLGELVVGAPAGGSAKSSLLERSADLSDCRGEIG
jgi:hypothetical protein